jgi:hypothetical protein
LRRGGILLFLHGDALLAEIVKPHSILLHVGLYLYIMPEEYRARC